MPFDDKIKDHEERRKRALAMGGPDKLKRRADAGLLNARERVDYLFDAGTFRESGLFGTSYLPAMRDQTPADGKVTGFGRIDGRRAGAVAYDFTVKGSSSSATNNKKMAHIKETGAESGFPVVFLSESTGVRMPDIMGEGMGASDEGRRFLRPRKAPWVSAQLGLCFGSSAWHAVAADSGFAHAVGETDEEAIDIVKQFLGYLPTHQNEAPPVLPVPPGSNEACKGMLDLIPEQPSKVYDVRTIIRAFADTDSLFEIKARYGRSLCTALARIDGRSVGIIANNPQFKGGAMDAESCTKATSFIVLCDSYNIPIVFLQDQPGFLIGPEAERQGVIGKIINWMNAMLQATVPKITIILRKSYGRGFINMGAANTADDIAAWWTAEVSFMDPRSAVSVVHGIDEKDDPERFQAHLAEMARDSTAYGLASVFGVKDVIDPRETRAYLIDTLDIHGARLKGGVGEHKLESWPTSFV
jgi:acetyl-CoA carboxylase carboxyltransferase component